MSTAHPTPAKTAASRTTPAAGSAAANATEGTETKANAATSTAASAEINATAREASTAKAAINTEAGAEAKTTTNTANNATAKPSAKRFAFLFAGVFVVYHAVFFTVAAYVLSKGFASMETGVSSDSAFLAFCERLVDVLMAPGLQLHEALDMKENNWLEWLLFFGINCVYCLLITCCLSLIGKRRQRQRA